MSSNRETGVAQAGSDGRYFLQRLFVSVGGGRDKEFHRALIEGSP
jgi:hypothetical protein